MSRMRLWFVLLATVMLVGVMIESTPSPTAAQDNWFVYVFDSDTKTLVRVNSDGSEQSFVIGDLPADGYLSAYDIRISPDGRRAAYCVSTYNPETLFSTSTLYVRDIDAEANLFTYDIGGNIGCYVGDEGFNEDGSQVAVGVVYYYVGDPAAPSGQVPWELLVFDVASGQLVHQLDGSLSSIAANLEFTDTAIMPIVRYFRNGQVIFIEAPWGTGGMPVYNALWGNLGQDNFQPLPRWGETFLTSLSTGELVWSSFDPNLPFSDPGGPIPSNNVVMLADKSGEQRMIYARGDAIIGDVEFINNGQQLAISFYAPFNEANPNEATFTSQWYALDRNGVVREIATHTDLYMDIEPAPNGYITYSTFYSPDYTSADHAVTFIQGDQIFVLWEGSGQGWGLVWAPEVPFAGDLTPFPTFIP